MTPDSQHGNACLGHLTDWRFSGESALEGSRSEYQRSSPGDDQVLRDSLSNSSACKRLLDGGLLDGRTQTPQGSCEALPVRLVRQLLLLGEPLRDVAPKARRKLRRRHGQGLLGGTRRWVVEITAIERSGALGRGWDAEAVEKERAALVGHAVSRDSTGPSGSRAMLRSSAWSNSSGSSFISAPPSNGHGFTRPCPP